MTLRPVPALVPALVLVLVLTGGCTTSTTHTTVATPSPPPSAPAPVPVPAPVPSPPTSISRASLTLVLAQGPGALLARVRVHALVDHARFAGWRIDAVPAAWATCGLLAGDVLLRVNSRRVERPEDLHAIWTALGTAPALLLEVARAGGVVTLLFPITD